MQYALSVVYIGIFFHVWWVVIAVGSGAKQD